MTKFKKNKKTETRLDLILLCQHVKLYSPTNFHFSGGSLRKNETPENQKLKYKFGKSRKKIIGKTQHPLKIKISKTRPLI
jgi:hypothetical protein